MTRRILGLTLGAVFALSAPALAQSPPVPPAQPLAYAQFSVSATGPTPWLYLNGQGVCTYTFTQAASAATITVQGASDSPNTGALTPQTVTSIGTTGVITTPAAGSAFGGSTVPQALTAIRLNVTALTGGLSGSVTCSTANVPGSGGGSGGSVTVANTVTTTPAAALQAPFVLTAASSTSCTSVSTFATTTLLSITNASTAAQTVTLSVFNDQTCTAGNRVFQGILGASQTINFGAGFGQLLPSGAAYTLSAAATANIVIDYAR